jgi:hypothetical protein
MAHHELRLGVANVMHTLAMFSMMDRLNLVAIDIV